MSALDDVILKRREAQAAKQASDLHNESIVAISDNGKEVVAATNKLAKTSDIDSLIAEVKEVQLAALLGSSKPSVVLTDQTDLGDKMQALGDKVASAVAGLDSSKTDSKQLAALTKLSSILESYGKQLATDTKDDKKAQLTLLNAIKAINIAPVVNVPAPKVTVQPSIVDLKPLQDTFQQYMSSDDDDKIDLDCYKAQDLKDDGNIQYVGFVNPEGNWYIIENNTKGNSLRYVFGSQGYLEAFGNASSYEYYVLNEAINALQT